MFDVVLNGTGYEDYDDLNNYDSELNLTSSRVMQSNGTARKTGRRKKSKLKHWEILALEQANQQTCPCRHHVTRVEGGQLVSDWCRCKDHRHDGSVVEHHSSGPGGEPTPRELRLKVNQIAYDWCKCSTHRNGGSLERRKSITLPAVSHRETHAGHVHDENGFCDCQSHRYKMALRKRQTGAVTARDEGRESWKLTARGSETETEGGRGRARGTSKMTVSTVNHHDESVHITPTPSSTRVVVRRTQHEHGHDEVPQAQTKRREVHTRTISTETKETPMTEIALAYNPADDDYEIIQEAIYYRTSSGRLVN